MKDQAALIKQAQEQVNKKAKGYLTKSEYENRNDPFNFFTPTFKNGKLEIEPTKAPKYTAQKHEYKQEGTNWVAYPKGHKGYYLVHDEYKDKWNVVHKAPSITNLRLTNPTPVREPITPAVIQDRAQNGIKRVPVDRINALRGILQRYEINLNGFKHRSQDKVQSDAIWSSAGQNALSRILNTAGQELRQFSFQVCVQNEYKKDDQTVYRWNTPTKNVILDHNQIKDAIMEQANKMRAIEDQGYMIASGFSVSCATRAEVLVYQYKPIRGASYIPTPDWIKKKHAIYNLDNSKVRTNDGSPDNLCFKWCILFALFSNPEDKNRGRISKYVNMRPEEMIYNGKQLDFSQVTYPTSLKDVEKFEKRNNLRIYVYGVERKEFVPLYISKLSQCDVPAIDLLLLEDSETLKRHYTFVSDLSRLLGSSMSKNEHHKFIHRECLKAFQSQADLDEHEMHCAAVDDNEMKTIMPTEKNSILKFTNYKNMNRVPFVFYSDFESALLPKSRSDNSSDPNTSSTTRTHHHVSTGYCLNVVAAEGVHNPFGLTLHSGQDVAPHFLQQVQSMENDIMDLYKNKNQHPIAMTPENNQHYTLTTICVYCQGEIKPGEKVRDHCHLTGIYRGAAHSNCNLTARTPTYIPCLFHNLKNYDAHFILNAIGKDTGRVSCIANNEEKYISFTINKVKFLDSFQFLPESLSALIDNLYGKKGEGKSKFKQTILAFKEHADLMIRKGVYPYEYVDSIERLNETQLPPKSAFYSTLTDEHISDEDYAHAQKVWETFQCNTLRDYHDIYLKADVTLLSDVFESFRDICLKNYGLDPAGYLTSPGLAWDAALKISQVKLELLTDSTIYNFFESPKSKRGGLAVISHRHAKANNKYLPNYDPSQPSKYLIDLDMNALYSGAMLSKLPVGGFRVLEQWELKRFLDDPQRILDLDDDAEFGYRFQVDLEYPAHLHDLHNDYPFAPESVLVTNSMLSPYAKRIKAKLCERSELPENKEGNNWYSN
eukprot:Pompholyxophrys_punicea_v1_NODE_8_length_8388_cov_12.748020.p1 type:complete len:997 gc:universal NODE_8_length_8388_cov_12.748020:3285-6275(+)